MKTSPLRSIFLRSALGVVLVAALSGRAQSIPYPPGNFDIGITLGCDCSCCCSSNNPSSNNPIGLFLTANPVTGVSATGAVAPVGQLVPPHWTEFLGSCTAPYDAAGAIHDFQPEGWTETVSTIPATSSTWENNSPVLPVNFSLCSSISFPLPFDFYADTLTPYGGSPGDTPVATPPVGQSTCQPYPWYVNATMQLQNGQVYNMEQQLVVAYFPLEEDPPGPPLETPVDYVETNGLLNITVVCTNGDVIPIYSATISATLDDVNIPAPLNLAQGWSFSSDLFENWSWPLTPNDLSEQPASLGNSPGAAGTLQASLRVSGPVNNTGLLVRANRSYTLTIGNIIMLATYNGINYPVYLPPITFDTGLVSPCAATNIVIYTTNCSVAYTPQTNGPAPCQDTAITGTVNMLGPPSPTTTIDVFAIDGPYGNSKAATPLSAPGTFLIYPMVGSDAFGLPFPGVPYQMYANMDLGTYNDYEFFTTPLLYDVYADCGFTNDITNVFVMCPTNPAVIQGTVSLCGPVDPNFFGGYPALEALQFASYNANGLPLDPNGNPDTTFQNDDKAYLSYIQVNGGQTAGPPALASPLFTIGGGYATTEFDNPGSFSPAPNSYVGNYTARVAGLEGQESLWSVNDLHLVFGPPVNLAYDVLENDLQHNNLNVSCGASTEADINICFGLVNITITNEYPQAQTYISADLEITGGTSDYIVGPLSFNNFKYQSPPPAGQNQAEIPLFLPAGTYQSVATVFDATGLINLKVTNNFTITCSCTNVVITNPCCTNCSAPYLDSYTVTLYPGTNYIADNICLGTNDIGSLMDDHDGIYDGSTVLFWNPATRNYTYDYADSLDSSYANGWLNGGIETLSPGEGFIVYSPSTNTVTFYGCEPGCPPPCMPSNGWSLVGGIGNNPVLNYSDLYTCPPPCGTEIEIYNPLNYQTTTYNYNGGQWSPALPVPLLNVGQAAWVDVNPNTGISVACTTNKSVAGGVPWTFDTPVASSCCSNLVTNIISTVTNELCPDPQTITRTWLFTDACGDSNTCSQTVTVPCFGILPVIGFSNLVRSSSNLVINWSNNPYVTTNYILTNIPYISSNWEVLSSTDLFHWTLFSTNTNSVLVIPVSSNTPQQFFKLILNQTPPTSSVIYQGLTNSPLGEASLALDCCISNLGSSGQDGVEALIITNLGSGGQDGVSIALPANFSDVEVGWLDLDDSNTLPIGSYIQSQIVGSSNGGPASVLGTLTFTKETDDFESPTNYHVAADFSALGVSTYTVQAYLQGALVAQTTASNGAPLTQCAIKIRPDIGLQHGVITFSIKVKLGYASGSIAGGPSISWDTLYLSPNVTLPSPPTAFQIVASQVPAISITNEAESLAFQGLTCTTLGSASESIDCCISNLGSSGQDGVEALIITNLGSGGQDGVGITIAPSITSWAVQWQALDLSNTLPVGAYLQAGEIGTGGLVSNSLLGSITVTKESSDFQAPTNYFLTANFPSSATNTFTVSVYNSGALQTSRSGLSGTLCAASQMLHDEDDNGRWTFPSNTVFTFTGSTGPASVQGDTLTVVPSDQQGATPSITGIQLLASGIPALVITNTGTSGEFTQLQVLLSGENNAPNTPTGKTGSPTPLALNGNPDVQEIVAVIAVDPNYYHVTTSVSDTIEISSSTDPGAILPPAASMLDGTFIFNDNNPFYFGDAGTWTITVQDTSNPAIPAVTSSPVTVGP